MNNLQNILGEIKSKNFHPIYCLMGTEAFFIDQIEGALRESVLEPHERDFNQHIFYGKDADMKSILALSRQFPVMAERQLVILREAQHIADKLSQLAPYAERPSESTILVVCIKGKVLARGNHFLSALKKSEAVVFESKTLYDNQWSGWANAYVRSRDRELTPKALQMLLESVGGNDLSKLANALDKLTSLVSEGRPIDEADIEGYIGISREFNYFEFTKALGLKDRRKLVSIARYFSDPSRKGDSPILTGILSKYLSQLLKVHSLTGQNRKVIVKELGLRSEYQATEYITAAGNYKMKELTRMLSIVREMDAKSKGVDADHFQQADYLKELIGEIA